MGTKEDLEVQITATDKASGTLKGLNSTLGGLAKTTGVALGAALGSAVVGLGALGASALSTNAELETATLQFETLLGSTDAAKEHIATLYEFAAKTPFETGPILQASRLLETFGGSALDSKENLTLFGNAAAVANVGIEEVSFWAGRAYSAIQAGRPFGEAAARLQEMGLLSATGRAELEELSASGADSTEVWGKFTEQFQRFDGAMEKQAASWQGLVSTIKDNVTLVIGTAFKPFFDSIKEAGTMVADFVQTDAFAAGAEDIAASLAPLATKFGDIATTLIGEVGPALFDGVILPFIQLSATVGPPILSLLGVLLGAFSDLTGALIGPLMETLMSLIGTILPPLGELLPSIAAVLGELGGAFLSILSPVLSLLGPLLEIAASILPQLLPVIQQITGPLVTLAQTILPPLGQLIGLLAAGFLQLVMIILPPLAGLFSTLITSLMPLLQMVLPALVPLINQLITPMTALITTLLPPMAVLFSSVIQSIMPLITEVLLNLIGLIIQTISATTPLIISILPPLVSLFGTLITAIMPLVTAVLPLLAPLLQVIIDLFTPLIQVLIPILNILIGAMQKAIEALTPVLQAFSSWISDKVIPAIDGITNAIKPVIDWIGRMADKLSTIKLPDWLTPGSPTPFELGLRGITKAMSDLNSGALPEFSSQLDIRGGSPIGAGGAIAGLAGGAGGVILQLNYQPMLSFADASEVKERIQPVVEEIIRKYVRGSQR